MLSWYLTRVHINAVIIVKTISNIGKRTSRFESNSYPFLAASALAIPTDSYFPKVCG